MSWLSQWMKEIIMIIMLATFIDLLLPNRSMQRYVKLMLSLIILLTLLSPVLKLFDAKLADQLASEWSSSLSSSLIAERDQTASITEIRRKGEQLAREQEASALRLAESEIGNQMKEQLALAFRQSAQNKDGIDNRTAEGQVQVEQLQVKLARNAKGEPIIERIELALSAGQAPSFVAESPAFANSDSGVESVKPVQHIQINAGSSMQEKQDGGQPQQSKSIPASGCAEQLEKETEQYRSRMANQAVRSLMSSWIVNAEKIKVEWTHKDSKL
ncbi:stage III sporulation protein AF [Paenibacillus alvei]|uniref:stage III sporulation protein AF n=1 Tax=Paenibacillus alvei TaxID=44250 RepID=UPI0013DBF27D|nr:stage III sporulation protein AF [Paenibacillus alvei]NEZ41613.1 stage III sporulation protein AF [Paenibacillus alvei]